MERTNQGRRVDDQHPRMEWTHRDSFCEEVREFDLADAAGHHLIVHIRKNLIWSSPLRCAGWRWAVLIGSRRW